MPLIKITLKSFWGHYSFTWAFSGYPQEDEISVVKDVEKRVPLLTVGWNVNCCSLKIKNRTII